MRLRERPILPTVRLCSMHQTVEVLPGLWKPHPFFLRAHRQHGYVEEAACPPCLQTARDALQQQFPALYACAPLLAQPSG